MVALLFASIGFALAQNTITVTGKVVAESDGQPVAGAYVLVNGTTIGTITDGEGKFGIKAVPADAKEIIVTFLGMSTASAKVTSEPLHIVMKEDATFLETVVVTGMQKTDKRLFTGSTVKVEGEKAKMDGMPEISRALEGRAAGVSVQNVSGTFGTAPKIRVRGATSIYGSSKPLWVVDGVIMEDVVEVDADALSSGDATTLPVTVMVF